MYPTDPTAQHSIQGLFEESQWYIEDSELSDLQTYVSRMRGDVIFARGWLLCEGQSDYTIIRYFAEMLGGGLDFACVALIDFQNNGSPGAFVGLAHSFGIPWLLLCDNDLAGQGYVATIKGMPVPKAEFAASVLPLPINGLNADMELYLTTNGFLADYEELIKARKKAVRIAPGKLGYEDAIAAEIRSDKTGYAAELVARLRTNGATGARVPRFFVQALESISKRAQS